MSSYFTGWGLPVVSERGRLSAPLGSLEPRDYFFSR